MITSIPFSSFFCGILFLGVHDMRFVTDTFCGVLSLKQSSLPLSYLFFAAFFTQRLAMPERERGK